MLVNELGARRIENELIVYHEFCHALRLTLSIAYFLRAKRMVLPAPTESPGATASSSTL
jgi:hypothetical protein